MQISIDKKSPFYVDDSMCWTVMLNGQQTISSVAANDDEGWVDEMVFVENDKGQSVLVIENGEIKVQRVYGKVQLSRAKYLMPA